MTERTFMTKMKSLKKKLTQARELESEADEDGIAYLNCR